MLINFFKDILGLESLSKFYQLLLVCNCFQFENLSIDKLSKSFSQLKSKNEGKNGS